VPAKRSYNIKGTKDFLVLSLIFFFLCLWAVKDAWYPSPKVVEKHPMEVAVSFEVSGSIGKVYIKEGDSIGEGQLLAELGRSKMTMEFDVAKKNYTTTKNKLTLMQTALQNAEKNGASDEGIAELRGAVDLAKLAKDEALALVGQIRASMEASEFRSPSKGVIKQILAPLHTPVEAGESVIIIDPKDHFYLFNKSLAIFSFIAFWVFLGLHILAH
jgi:multidrug resistance efflux pump